MGLISGVLAFLFGGGRNLVRETVEVFHENADAAAERSVTVQGQAMSQFGAEFHKVQKGAFDRFMDGLNRVPRPALALGTLGLFVAAMVDPIWFAARMQGIALVPEPLWWLLGVIVSFYFGARHHSKVQDLQREIAAGMTRVPVVVENLRTLQTLDKDMPTHVDAGADQPEVEAAVDLDENRALEDWMRLRGA